MFLPLFIRNILFEGEHLRAIGRSGNATRVFAMQGNLDASCCIYSLMMMLILNKKLDWDDLIKREKEKENEFVHAIHQKFLKNLMGYYRGGHTMLDISNKLNECYNDKLSEFFTIRSGTRRTVSRKGLHKKIKAELDKREPVMLAYRKKNGDGHAVVAIGYCMNGTEKMRLFCLDPSHQLSFLQIWNNVIDLDFLSEDNKALTDYNYFVDDNVIVDEIITINSDPGLPF